jgi:DNA polymerase-3 subunit gamma/tau
VLWQRILAGLQLPSTRMLLTQQARLQRLDERRAVVRVASTWLTMVQSRLPLLEKAMEAALGSPRQITLEPGDREERSEPPASEPAPSTAVPSSVMPSTAGPSAIAPPASQPENVAGRESPQTPAPPSPRQPLVAAMDPPAEPPVGAKPEELAKPTPQTENRSLETSTALLADFFNGQVIAMDARDDP